MRASFGAFSAEEIPLPEIEDFFGLDGIEAPDDRPYAWCMSVATLDGVTSMLEEGAMAGQTIALKHITGSGSGADWRLLNAGWMYADAVIGTGQILRVEPDIVWIPRDDDLVRYRTESLGKSSPFPINIVLTGSGNIDLSHPIFNDARFETVLISSESGREKILAAAEEAKKSGHQPFENGNTSLQVFGNSKRVDHRDVFRFMRQELDVRHLEVTAGGTVIGALAREKLLDECRITYAGNYAGPFNPAGERRPGLFDVPPDLAFSHEDNPLVRFMGIRVFGERHLFVRGKFEYRH